MKGVESRHRRWTAWERGIRTFVLNFQWKVSQKHKEVTSYCAKKKKLVSVVCDLVLVENLKRSEKDFNKIENF